MPSLLSDQAICEGRSEQAEGLGFTAYARVLALAAIDTRGPFTIGVFGEWGTGKTSLMRLVQKQLDQSQHVVTVWFNAWRYEQEEHPIVPLVGTIVRELERHKSFRQHLEGGGKSLVRALRAVAYGFSAKSKIKLPGFAEIEASFVAKDMIDREQTTQLDPLLDRSLYYDAFESLGAAKLSEKLRIVVLIDDLDRCFPNQAIRLLESIKLVLCQQGFIFLLGVARQVLEGYLQHRYSTEFGIANFQGQLYLDKVVQLPFSIPPAIGRMDTFCNVILNEIEEKVRCDVKDILPLVGEALGGNPRAVIRFANNLLIDRAINIELKTTIIPVEFFAISRYLQQRCPEIFDLLTRSDELARKVSEWDAEAVRTHAAGGETQRPAVLLLADPNLQALLLGTAGKKWLAGSSLRHESVHFLRSQQRLPPGGGPPVRKRYDAFVNFAERDREEVSRIVELLAQNELKILMDVNTGTGVKWDERLNYLMRESAATCVFIGRAGQFSVARETETRTVLSMAASEADFTVIPVLLPGATSESVPAFLSGHRLLEIGPVINSESLRPLLDALKP
jgi:hypothetical protein